MPLVLAGALLLSVMSPAAARAAQAPGAVVSLDEARRLTWRRDTRPEGVAALRNLVSGNPEAIDAPFELGRVLTWDATTRAEGTTILRRLSERVPERADVEEALAQVLSWNTSTRAEAIRRLRGLVEREPDRTSARLILAEVLSWNSVTRDESESLYRSVLRTAPSSMEARVGLARLLSWRGDMSESRALYAEALVQEPGDAAARLGLAEAQRWSGLARASLATLSALPAGTTETPDAFQRRGEAYSQIGRPARALEEYDALLAIEPKHQAALQAAGSIRRSLRPVLEIGGEGSTESGDRTTSQVRTSSFPIRFSWHPGNHDTEVSISTALASYWNDQGPTRDRSVGAGFDTPVGNRARVSAEATFHDFEQDRRTVTGSVQAILAATDRLDFRFGGTREQLFSSRLSLGGEEIDRAFYGPAISNEVFVRAAGRLGRRWDLWIHAARGTIDGENLASNNRDAVYGGFGRSFRPGPVTIRPGYSATWFSYDRDLGGFPAADVGGDGISRRGVGGYFSPFRFLNQMARLDATLPIGQSLLIVAGGGAGRQQVEDTGSRDFSRRTTSSDAYLGFRLPVGDRMALRGQVSYQNVASAFDRTIARLSIAYSF